MKKKTDNKENLKFKAAEYALSCVENGMTLGLGSGSTTTIFISLLGERIQAGELIGIRGVPTSEKTARHARQVGIPLTSISDLVRENGMERMDTLLDLAVDGADEVDPELNLIKGLGRALLREKIVEIHTDRLIVIVDDSKLVRRLGTKGPLPVEIVSFEADAHIEWINTLGCYAELWKEQDGTVVRSDNGNPLVLCTFPDGIVDPWELATKLKSRPGIVEHGLFLDMARLVIVSDSTGIRCLER
ncbi:MAG: ribose-5-phosphate isomerase RpiA [Anaerolineales bacterium]|nr:ribose-5-phosphate isomerase RpiA [Anaerolineales bacterium]